MDIKEFEHITKKLKKTLKTSRYIHTLGVSFTAAALAMVHIPGNVREALIAGLLHDCGKLPEISAQLDACKKYHVSLDEYESKNPALVHAKLGARIAKAEYGIENEDILAAIRTHTTGEPDMSALQKIIYIADYIEPNRDDNFPKIEEIRRMAFSDLDKAVCVISMQTLGFLKAEGKMVDPKTEETYNYYKNQAV